MGFLMTRRTSPFFHVRASRRLPFAARCRLGRSLSLFQETSDPKGRAVLEVEGKDLSDEHGLELVHDQPLFHDRVTKGHRAARPLPLPARARDLVARPLGDHFPLKFGKTHQHVEREPSHRIGS